MSDRYSCVVVSSSVVVTVFHPLKLRFGLMVVRLLWLLFRPFRLAALILSERWPRALLAARRAASLATASRTLSPRRKAASSFSVTFGDLPGIRTIHISFYDTTLNHCAAVQRETATVVNPLLRIALRHDASVFYVPRPGLKRLGNVVP